MDRCLHLRLSWDLIVNLKGFNAGGHQSAKGLRVLPQVTCGVFLGALSHVGPERVGIPGVRVTVPEF